MWMNLILGFLVSNRLPTVTAMKPLPAQAVLVAATAEGTLRLLDTRSPLSYQHELKVRRPCQLGNY